MPNETPLYSVNVYCTNCGSSLSLLIAQKILVKDVACPTCGCKALVACPTCRSIQKAPDAKP